MSDSVQHSDVLVIGAGLVGATIALALAQTDEQLQISVVDQGDEPELPPVADSGDYDPRVVALTPATIAWLTELGVWPQVADRACAYEHMTVWDDEGTGQIEFDAAELQQPSLGSIIENRVLLYAVLVALKQQQNVTFFRGEAVTATSIVEGKRQITLDDGKHFLADLVIGADGANSPIRQLEGLDIRSWPYNHHAIVATVKTEQSHQKTAWQNFIKTGPLAFLPLADKSQQYCSIVWSLAVDEAEQKMALDDTEFQTELAKALEYRLGNVIEISKRFRLPLVQRHAIEYIAPSLALVGDAAHTVHPLAGQGVNMGLQDAMALTAEVRRARTRRLSLTDPSLLRRYQRARKRDNMQMMMVMEGFKRLFESQRLPLRWLRNTGMRNLNKISTLKNWLAKQAMGL